MPPNSPDIATAKKNLLDRYREMEAYVLRQINDLAKSGIADKRLCAIAMTDIQHGMAMLARALETGGPDGRDYGKVPMPEPLPKSFTPDPDPEPLRNVADTKQIGDYSADGKL